MKTSGAKFRSCRLLGGFLAALPLLACTDRQEWRVTTAEVMDEVEKTGSANAAVEISLRGNDKVVLKTADQSLPVSNPEALKLPVTNLPATAVVTLDESTKTLRLESYTLQATDRWNNLSTADKSRYASVTQAHTALAATVAAYQSLPGVNADAAKRDLFAKVTSAKKSVVEEYGRLDSAARSNDQQLVGQYAILKKTGKSIYGFGDDRYPPEAYTRIYSNRVVALALGRPGESKSKCSGTLISKELALTNYHCISPFMPGDLEARFDYEENLEGVRLPQKVFPVEEYVVSDHQQRAGLDFALLRLGINSEGQLPGSVYKPACLSSARVQPYDPVYLIGYPLGEPRTVHDNAYVLFPFRITKYEYDDLELNVRTEFLGTDDEQEQLDSFRASYRPVTINNQVVYENFSTRFRQQPTIGADFDSYHGNSGSPAFHRRTHRVVGLLFDGEEDVSQPLRPGWRAHEAILPITEVMKRLDAARPTWRTSPDVCIDR